MTTDPSTEEAPVTATPPESAFHTTGLDHVTLIGSNEAETIEFYRDVLGMPLVLRQPNLDQPEVTHLFFDTGDGRILTFFVEDDRDSSRQPLRTPIGGVHHVAFTVDPERFDEVKSGLSEHGYQFNEFDRGIFHSLYTRDHNGLTIEFATDKYEIPDDRRGKCSRSPSPNASKTARNTPRPSTSKRRFRNSVWRARRSTSATPPRARGWSEMSDTIHADQPTRTAGAPLAEADAAVVMFHGRGATAQSILSFAGEFDHDGVAYVAPQAARNTWYPQSFMAPMEQNEPWLSAALDRVDQAIADVEDQGIPADRIVLLGFSPGRLPRLGVDGPQHPPLRRPGPAPLRRPHRSRGNAA